MGRLILSNTQMGFDTPLEVVITDTHVNGYAAIRPYIGTDVRVYPTEVDVATYPEEYNHDLTENDFGYIEPVMSAYNPLWTSSNIGYIEPLIEEAYVSAEGTVTFEGWNVLEHKWNHLDNGIQELSVDGLASWQGPIGIIRASVTDLTGSATGYRLNVSSYAN